MLEDDDMSLALRTAAPVRDHDLPRIPASVSADLAREIVDATVEPAEATAAPRNAALAHWTRRRRLVLAAGLVAAAVSAVTLLQTFGSAAPTAFADWQPVPQILTGAAAQADIAKCPLGVGMKLEPIPASDQILVEQRGRMVTIVYSAGRLLGYCMLLDGRGDGGGSIDGVPQPTGSNIVSEGSASGFTFDASGAKVVTSNIIGRAGPQVSSILIHRADGVVVTAAVSHGLWAAWWPGDTAAITLTVQTEDGPSHDVPVSKTVPIL
ncbi:MAG TPA: hypothetical protein VFN97_20605 [Actinospica sp.]|nr:hypothetical protein [Actinospica sp.]